MKTTTNYKFKKPDGTDAIDINVLNNNADAIDVELKKINDNAYIHPRTHPSTMITGLAQVATSGSYNDLIDKPTIVTNIVDGNGFCAVRGIKTESDYTMGDTSTAIGRYTTASGNSSTAMGLFTIAQGQYQTAVGCNNIAEGIVGTHSPTDGIFIIGNGASSSSRGNAFKVLWNGETHADGAYSSNGADYAEMFEWLDGNPDNEDRVGLFVTFDGEKIRKANADDDYILGVVSANPAILGDNSMRWHSKFLTDDWGRTQYKTITIPAETDEEGKIIVPEHEEEQPVLNPKFDIEQNEIYEERQYRREWSAVGMMGKLLIRDDGSCKVNGYCKPNENGIGTKGESGYRVMKRVRDNIVMVLVK